MAFGMRFCSCCGDEKGVNNFFPSSTIATYDNRSTICKTCAASIYKIYIKKFKNTAAAVWSTLSVLSTPFINEVWIATVSAMNEAKIQEEKTGKKSTKLPFVLYLEFFEDYKEKQKIKTYSFADSDTMLDMLIEVSKQENYYTDTKEKQLNWGYYSDSDDYDFLEFMYKQYTEPLTDMSPIMVQRYRDLCKAELRKRKADEEGDDKKISSAQKDIIELMKMLKLDNFKEDKSKDEIHLFIERMAFEIENTKPCECEDLEKYKDYCGAQKLASDLMRPLRNLIAGTREYPTLTKE